MIRSAKTARLPRPAKSARRPRPANGRRIRLLLVDDHPVVREGLRSCLAAHPDLHIVGEAASGEEALLKATRLKPDVVLMDINLPGISGLEATGQLRQLMPLVKVLVLTVQEGREYMAQVARHGAHGYILKDTSPDELARAIVAVHHGQAVFSQQLSEVLAQPDSTQVLTAREREVLVRIAQGERGKDIANCLQVAHSTIKTLRERLMRKLGRHSIAALTQYALEQGLIAPPAARNRPV